ncbi:MAG: hypothetical protein M1828_007499, partial [Chrysothrix sp. TS-e1954]
CDEHKPCGACIKRELDCSLNLDYAAAETTEATPEFESLDKHTSSLERTSRTTFTEDLSPREGAQIDDVALLNHRNDSPRLSVLDYELLHHFLTSQCLQLTGNGGNEQFWAIEVHQIGLSNHFVLHLLLALSATHLSRQRPQMRDHFVKTVDHHLDVALPLVRRNLTNIDADNARALYVSSILLCLCSLGQGPKAGEYIAFSDEGHSEWFTLFVGVRSLNISIGAGSDSLSIPDNALSTSHFILPTAPRPVMGWKVPMEELRDFIVTMTHEETAFQFYVTELDLLRAIYEARYDDSKGELSPEYMRIIFVWLFRCSETYISSLQDKKPIALVIFAYFATLLKEFEWLWIFDGWSTHVLGGIWRFLPEKYRKWIVWPVEELKFQPP